MRNPIVLLVVGLVLFLGVHLLPTVPRWRLTLVQRWGEQRYKGAFALVSLVGLVLIVVGYGRGSPGPRLFEPSATAIALAPYLMTLSLVLFAAANLRSHIRRVLKHPMLMGLAIWAAVHLLANGDARGTVLFGSFLAYALVDFVSAVQRHATKLFVPTARHDVIAVVAGVVAALLIMQFHRSLFGVDVALWHTADSAAALVAAFIAASAQVGMMA